MRLAADEDRRFGNTNRRVPTRRECPEERKWGAAPKGGSPTLDLGRFAQANCTTGSRCEQSSTHPKLHTRIKRALRGRSIRGSRRGQAS